MSVFGNELAPNLFNKVDDWKKAMAEYGMTDKDLLIEILFTMICNLEKSIPEMCASCYYHPSYGKDEYFHKWMRNE